MKRLITITTILTLSCNSVNAQWQGDNERKWGPALESDIRNGAPANLICINAKSSGFASNEVAFKNWAYEIARQYCDPSEMGSPQMPPGGARPQKNSKDSSPERCRLTAHQMHRASLGHQVMVAGPNCSMSFN